MSNSVNISPNAKAPGGVRMLVAMVGIGLFCALLIVVTYEYTKPIIFKNKMEALDEAVLKVLPGATQQQTVDWMDYHVRGERPTVRAGFDPNGELVGFAVNCSGQGYADVIRILVGYDPEEQKVMGMYVLDSKETPGLGDKIEKDVNFLQNFQALDVRLATNGEGLVNKVVAVKNGEKKNAWEIDGITGATISSRAIADMINRTMQDHAAALISIKDKVDE